MADRDSFGDRYRAGWHRAGLLWNRICGTFLVVIGVWALSLSLGSESFSVATHWPTFVAVAGLWWLARWFFKARDVVIEPFDDGEGHPGTPVLRDPILKLDRKLGIVWARICGTLFAIGGGFALISVAALPDFSLATYWPVFGMSALLLLAARACFKARTGLMDTLSEVPLSRSETAARRRDVAVVHQGRGGDKHRADAKHTEER